MMQIASWTVHEESGDDYTPARYILADEMGEEVASFPHTDCGFKDAQIVVREHVAHDALVAALRQASGQYAAFVEQSGLGHDKFHLSALARVRAVIKLAEGK